MAAGKRRKWRRLAVLLAGLLVAFLILVVFLANVFMEPALRKRLQTLIVEGSDSLYTYKLGDLHVNLLAATLVFTICTLPLTATVLPN